MFGHTPPEHAERHRVKLPDGDYLILHDDRPTTWDDTLPVVLLIHGLGGSHRSNYMVRIARQLQQHGMRTYRLDMRGCGAGRGWARHPYHSGRSDDMRQALAFISQRHPRAALHAVSFSLGANALLKMLTEMDDSFSPHLTSAIAVSPPVDLAASVRALNSPMGRFYDRFFTHELVAHVLSHPHLCEHADSIFRQRPATCLYDFDERFTAPLSGFLSADDYYQRCSSGPRLKHIHLPTTIIAAKDDPIVPWQPLYDYVQGTSVSLLLTDYGGHLGFIARDKPHRWLDQIILTRLLAHAL
jgi:uncharacterized protein